MSLSPLSVYDPVCFFLLASCILLFAPFCALCSVHAVGWGERFNGWCSRGLCCVRYSGTSSSTSLSLSLSLHPTPTPTPDSRLPTPAYPISHILYTKHLVSYAYESTGLVSSHHLFLSTIFVSRTTHALYVTRMHSHQKVLLVRHLLCSFSFVFVFVPRRWSSWHTGTYHKRCVLSSLRIPPRRRALLLPRFLLSAGLALCSPPSPLLSTTSHHLSASASAASHFQSRAPPPDLYASAQR